MNFEEVLKLAVEGKKIPNDVWKKLTPDQKRQIKEARNDPHWYAISEQIARDVASLPYNVMSGVGFDQLVRSLVVSTTGSMTRNTTTTRWREMSTFVVKYIRTPGYATQKSDGINMASLLLYTAIRRRNSGARNYEAADVMMYVLAMREIYSLAAKIRKCIGLAGRYALENHYIPDMLLQAENVDASDLRQNLASYRGRFNLLVKKINAFAVPKFFKAFDRAVYLESNVFMDSTSIRGQFYCINTDYYGSFSATASENGSSIQFTRIVTDSMTLTLGEWMDKLESMIDNMFLDDDINTMSGDILKAFDSPEKLYAFNEVGENFVLEFVFDQNILQQIENSYCIYQSTTNAQSMEIAEINYLQSKQVINYTPSLKMKTASSGQKTFVQYDKLLFNSHKDNPDYWDNLEWSRLISTVNFEAAALSDNDSMIRFPIQNFGLEITLYYKLYSYASNGQTEIKVLFNTLNEAIPNDIIVSVFAEQFDWHPIVYTYAPVSPTVVNAVGSDLKKYTAVSISTIKLMHETAVTATFWSDDLYQITKG